MTDEHRIMPLPIGRSQIFTNGPAKQALRSNHSLRPDLKALANGLPLMASIVITRDLIQTASGAQLVISVQI